MVLMAPLQVRIRSAPKLFAPELILLFDNASSRGFFQVFNIFNNYVKEMTVVLFEI